MLQRQHMHPLSEKELTGSKIYRTGELCNVSVKDGSEDLYLIIGRVDKDFVLQYRCNSTGKKNPDIGKIEFLNYQEFLCDFNIEHREHDDEPDDDDEDDDESDLYKSSSSSKEDEEPLVYDVDVKKTKKSKTSKTKTSDESGMLLTCIHTDNALSNILYTHIIIIRPS